MKLLVDVDRLVADGVITAEQAAEMRRRSRDSLTKYAINFVLLLGVVLVFLGILGLELGPETVILTGFLVFVLGIASIHKLAARFDVIANAVSLIGVATFLAGVYWLSVLEHDATTPAIAVGIVVAGIDFAALRQFGRRYRFILAATTFFGVATHIAGIAATQSDVNIDWLMHLYAAALLVATGVGLNVRFITALSVIAFASALSAAGYRHATYSLAIFEPTLSIIQFTAIAGACWWFARRWHERYARHARIVGLLSFVWINMAFWVGSLWGDDVGQHLWGPTRAESGGDRSAYERALEAFEVETLVVPDLAFVAVWAALIVVLGTAAALANNRGVFNAAVTFGVIHFYTQWFERLQQSAITMILSGAIAILIAWGTYQLNVWLKQRGQSAQTGGE